MHKINKCLNEHNKFRTKLKLKVRNILIYLTTIKVRASACKSI